MLGLRRGYYAIIAYLYYAIIAYLRENEGQINVISQKLYFLQCSENDANLFHKPNVSLCFRPIRAKIL